MEYFMFFIGPSIVFLIQLIICIKCSNKLVKLIPTVLLLLGIGLCVYTFFTSYSYYDALLFYGIILCVALCVDGLAWGIYLMYRFAIKQEEKEECE